MLHPWLQSSAHRGRNVGKPIVMASDLLQTVALIEQGIAQGLHLGAQLYASREGRVVADLGIGQSRPGVAMTAEMLMAWQSAGKPLTAVAIGKLWELGRLHLDDPVAKFIPEFGVYGKEGITIRHLLTHTGGIRWANFSAGDQWERVIEAINTVRPEPRWVAGRKAGYHAVTSWYLLGEILRRLEGRDFESALRGLVLQPAGMKNTVCRISADEARNNPQISGLYDTRGGKAAEDRSTIGNCSPGSSLRGPVRELGRFYELLLKQAGVESDESANAMVRPQTVEAMTARHRVGMYDHTFKRVLDWGLGFIVNNEYLGGDIPYGFGPYASMRTFGHGGRQSSIAFADPQWQLVVALAFNGMPGEKEHDHRARPILAALYEELGLAEESPGERTSGS